VVTVARAVVMIFNEQLKIHQAMMLLNVSNHVKEIENVVILVKNFAGIVRKVILMTVIKKLINICHVDISTLINVMKQEMKRLKLNVNKIVKDN